MGAIQSTQDYTSTTHAWFEELKKAVVEDDKQKIAEILSKEEDYTNINTPDDHGLTVLVRACRFFVDGAPSTELLKTILCFKSLDVNAPVLFIPALHFLALSSGDSDCMEILLSDKRTNVNIRASYGNPTPLALLIDAGNHELVTKFLKCGKEINTEILCSGTRGVENFSNTTIAAIDGILENAKRIKLLSKDEKERSSMDERILEKTDKKKKISKCIELVKEYRENNPAIVEKFRKREDELGREYEQERKEKMKRNGKPDGDLLEFVLYLVDE
jgi:hypothetical protein